MSLQTIYLDYAAATPLDERVFAVMEPHLRQYFANPSSLYRIGHDARAVLEEARRQLAMSIDIFLS